MSEPVAIAEQALGSGLPDLTFFIENYPSAAVLLNQACIVLLASDKFLKDYSLLPSDILNRRIFDVFEEFKLIPDSDTLRSVIDLARASGKVYITTDIQGDDGSFWSVRSNPIVRGGVFSYELLSIHETTDDHLARQAITDQMDTADSYKILVEQAKDYAMFIIDPIGNVKTWNMGAQLLKGYTKEEVIGKHFSIFYLKDDIEAGKPRKELEIALREGRVEDESRRVKKDGTTFWANVIITAMYRDGKHIGFSKMTRDLTERKASETRVIDAYKDADKAKSQFLATMSHEMRTPLHGLLASLEEVCIAGISPEQEEPINDMKESGRYLGHVIGGILDYSALESGGLSLSISLVNLHTIANAVLRSLKSMVKTGVLFQATCDSDVPESLKGDPDRYRQILQNIAANALKFTESGFVSIHISIKDEDVTSFTILTTVTDTGIGIAEKDVGLLFRRFSQIDNSSTKKYRGTGLGLSICKNLVELMDGSIEFTPNPVGHGSVFEFTVKMQRINMLTPMSESDDMLDSLMLSHQPPSPKSELRALAASKRLLLAEDNPLNQKVAVKALKRLGFEYVDTVVNGAEAVAKAKENRLVYDGILMDVSMPVMDGKEATKEIRLAGVGTPIIAMTANALKTDVDEYLAIGMNGYVSKPVNSDLLVAALLKWLK
ncbi:uncharacterized protein LY89DRAFT_642365 [Mollisia scopiformis]|uniref:histidine kinase n=1 Tax=Mollisia scopiformis TaxID=149040 RepID=A0A194XGL6_MOLSC|nr:uncharacterized protein LY89DRAFT_642365 [Mollisia scopiformis]KUJ19340.1 hypothetical protein LY89DRAFT_642365 [Mollisia scopiformis]